MSNLDTLDTLDTPGTNYYNIINEVKKQASLIGLSGNNEDEKDGRIYSAIKEKPFLKELRERLIKKHPNWNIIISPPRASCDIMINNIRINLKLTDCKTSDNSLNKPSIYFSITGSCDYPYSSNWNDFIRHITNAKTNNKIKLFRDRTTEYHYLVKNKITGQVLLKSIFDIHTYVSNPSNILQINWKNEFSHVNYVTGENEYKNKIKELLSCIQKSVRDMILKSINLAESNLDDII